jgi:hypothetical protein
MSCSEVLADLPRSPETTMIKLKYIDDSFEIDAEKELLTTVQARLTPFIVRSDQPDDSTVLIRVVQADEHPLAETVRARGRRIAIDESLYEESRSDGWRLELEDGWAIVIEKTGTLCVFCPAERTILLTSPSMDALLGDTVRTIKSLVGLHAEDRGYPMFHASGTVTSDGAVLFLGDSRDGKTTILLHCLTGFRTKLLSCDTSVLRLEGSRLIARGWPSNFSLSVGTSHDFPMLLPLMGSDFARLPYTQAWDIYPKEVLHTHDVVDALRTSFLPESDVRALVAVRFDPESPTGIVRHDDVDELERTLGKVCLGSRDSLYPNWHGWWTPSDEDLTAHIRRVAQDALDHGVEFHRMTWAPGPETLLRRVDVLDRAVAAEPLASRDVGQ